MREIPRYTLGFKYFGPLEQCSTGELCKAEEVAQFEHFAKNCERYATDAQALLQDSLKLGTAALEQRNAWRDTAKQFRVLSIASMALNVVLGASLVYVAGLL